MDDLSEKEQIEKMRTWWTDYGNYVIAGVVLGAAILFAINYYQTSMRDAQLEASQLYDELTDLVVDGDLDAAEAVTGRIDSDFPDSAYAPQSKLAIARLYMDQNRDQDAADALADLIAGDAEEVFKQVARLRLAKIYLYQGKAGEAAALLEDDDSDAFEARYADVLGDAYVGVPDVDDDYPLGRFDDARDAYQRALSEPNQGATVDRQFVQLKLLDLPLETANEAAGSDDAGNDDAGNEEAGDEEAE